MVWNLGSKACEHGADHLSQAGGTELWPGNGRRMREMIFKALNLGSEYAQADGEAMDLTDPWLLDAFSGEVGPLFAYLTAMFRGSSNNALRPQDCEAAALRQLTDWGFAEEAAQRALLAERGSEEEAAPLAAPWQGGSGGI